MESDGVERYRAGDRGGGLLLLPRGDAEHREVRRGEHGDVRLADGSGTLAFEVTDDGAGFDPGSTGYGTGLQGMADRLDAMGG